jgi:hypothetical protein
MHTLPLMCNPRTLTQVRSTLWNVHTLSLVNNSRALLRCAQKLNENLMPTTHQPICKNGQIVHVRNRCFLFLPHELLSQHNFKIIHRNNDETRPPYTSHQASMRCPWLNHTNDPLYTCIDCLEGFYVGSGCNPSLCTMSSLKKL